MRYASVHGDGLLELRRYKESLTPLNEAIKLANANPYLAYPSIAVNSKIDALRGLRRHDEALALSADTLAHLQNASLKGHEFQILMSRADIYEDLNQWSQAIAGCNRSLVDARILSYWRGITEAGGFLTLAHEHQGQLPEALKAIDEAIGANTDITDELYFVPRNLAIKAEITQKLGNAKESDELYRKSAALIDAMLAHAPTQNVQRYELAQIGYVYSDFFASLCTQKKYEDAFRVL